MPAAHFILDSAGTELNAPAAPYQRRLIPLREAVALAFRAGGLRRVGVLGRSPKRILVPFVRTKGTPRRRAVQALHPAYSPRRL